jgi:hypothetical protein
MRPAASRSGLASGRQAALQARSRLEQAGAWAGLTGVRRRGGAGVGSGDDRPPAEARVWRRGRPAAGASRPTARASGPAGAMAVGQSTGRRRRKERKKKTDMWAFRGICYYAVFFCRIYSARYIFDLHIMFTGQTKLRFTGLRIGGSATDALTIVPSQSHSGQTRLFQTPKNSKMLWLRTCTE